MSIHTMLYRARKGRPVVLICEVLAGTGIDWNAVQLSVY